jgi:hypothetical protein
MKNADYVYAVIFHYEDDNNIRAQTMLDVDSIHKTLGSAEKRCAEANKWRQNAKPNPEFKKSYMPQHKNYIKIDKTKPASWFYVKMMQII